MYNSRLERVFDKMVKEFGMYVLTTDVRKCAVYPGMKDAMLILYENGEQIWILDDLKIYENVIVKTKWNDVKRLSTQYIRFKIRHIIERYKKLTNELRMKELEKDFRND